MTKLLCLILTNFNSIHGQEITKILQLNDDNTNSTFLPNPQQLDSTKVLEFKTLPNEIHQNNEDFTLFTFFNNNSSIFPNAPKLLFGATFFHLLALTQEEKQLECNKDARGVRMKSLSVIILDKNIPFLFSCENLLKQGLKEIFFVESLTSMTILEKDNSIKKIMTESLTKLAGLAVGKLSSIPTKPSSTDDLPQSPVPPEDKEENAVIKNYEEKEFILSIFKFLLFQHVNPKTHDSFFKSNSITFHTIPLNFMTLLKCLLLQDSFLIFGSDIQNSTFRQFSVRNAGLLKISRLVQEIKKSTLLQYLKMNQELTETVKGKCKKLFPYFLLTVQEVFSESNALLDTFMDPTKGLNEYFYLVSFTDKIFFNHLSKYVTDASSKNPKKKEPNGNSEKNAAETDKAPPNILSLFPIVINLEDNEIIILQHHFQSASKANKLKRSLQITKSDKFYLEILKNKVAHIEDPAAKEKELEVFICNYTKALFQELSIKNDLNKRRLMNYSSISDTFATGSASSSSSSFSMKLDFEDGPFLERLAHKHACNIQFNNDAENIQKKRDEENELEERNKRNSSGGFMGTISNWFSYLNCCVTTPTQQSDMIIE